MQNKDGFGCCHVSGRGGEASGMLDFRVGVEGSMLEDVVGVMGGDVEDVAR